MNDINRLAPALSRVLFVLLLGFPLLQAQAQFTRATPEELNKNPLGKGSQTAVETSVAPSTDPTDFSGTWRPARGAPSGPRPAAPAANGAQGPVPGSAPGARISIMKTADRTGKLSARILCLPQQDPTYAGVDGPTLIVQTPDQITWASEELHHIRRIFLNGTYTPDFEPNYLGEAIGHWEGNTLVIETRGLASLDKGVSLVERWTKSEGGMTFTNEKSYVDENGQPIGNVSTSTFAWRPDQDVLEWICEDFNEEWLPGGEDYEDQLQ